MSLADTAISTLTPFLEFLEQRARVLGVSSTSKISEHQPVKKAQVHHNSNTTNQCKLYSQSHLHFKFPTLLKLSVPERRTLVLWSQGKGISK